MQGCVKLKMKNWSDDIVSAHGWLSLIVLQYCIVCFGENANARLTHGQKG